ncbi:hypothetical protein ASPCAL05360 [Aspergillus calidoustus]|uniref:Uncharacterized protein n=1 Tax=Aspergillus calidoustus TaxID=454130 RepID=A0A0U4Z3J3_ASPCI|nr:hypothetical protein ASPCAL05360 [Aspergillus calidoustus]
MTVTTLIADSPAELVKQTLRSTSTANNATVLSLQTLFRSTPGPTEIESVTVKRTGRATKTTSAGTAATTSSRTKTARSRTNTKTAVQDPGPPDGAQLSAQEKLVLATEVFNMTLKTLSDAVNVGTAPSPRESTPVKRTTKSARSKTAQAVENRVSEADKGVSAVAECARLSLSCLRTLKTEQGGQGDGMPNLQLEQGACVLAGRLLSLGLNDLAYKELRGLKRRIQQHIDGLSTSRKKAGKDTREEDEQKERMSDLLTFSNIPSVRSLLGLLVSFQSSALRLIAAEKRPATVQKLVSALQLADDSSPANVILAAIDSGALSKDKGAIQLQLLSSTVSSLSYASQTSSSGGKDRLKPSTVLALQLLSLEIRCMSWKISGHICDDEHRES